MAARANISSSEEQVRAARIAAEGTRQEQQVGGGPVGVRHGRSSRRSWIAAQLTYVETAGACAETFPAASTAATL